MAIFSPSPSSLEEILEHKRYEVPMYQRRFSWTIDEAHELWSDIEKNNAPYFLGILVFQKTKYNKTFKVVDGQQRLATLLLLLRSAVETLGIDSLLGNKLQDDYINQKRFGEEESQFSLRLSERDMYDFFSLLDTQHIKLPPILSPRERKGRRTVSSVRLKNVKKFFLEKMTSLKNKKGDEGIKSFIKEKVLNVSFIQIQLEDDNDIFLFFETLNARGIDLTIADLLKNRVCSVSDYPESAANRIDEISSILGEGKMNSFLLHYCLALSEKSSPPTKKELMSWYSETIGKEKDQFLITLKEYAEIYSLFLDPKKIKSSELREVLSYLKVLGATRCYPLLLVGYKFLSPKEFLKLCKAVETLTFRHSTIVGRDAKILEDVYYNLSQLIKNNKTLDKDLEILNEQAKKIPDDLFESAFKAYVPGNNQVAKYILLKIENLFNSQLTGLDWDDLTLEHILPEKSNWDGREEFLERLGNMALLKGKINTTIGNKEFKIKKEYYKNETRIKLTQDLASYQDFTKETIVQYQEHLAKLACKVWNPR